MRIDAAPAVLAVKLLEIDAADLTAISLKTLRLRDGAAVPTLCPPMPPNSALLGSFILSGEWEWQLGEIN
jgi:hypothetical protein